MIQRLHIENFKTIKSLDLACKRYNVFIGDTNTGKTNILEALSLVSQGNMKSSGTGRMPELDRRIIRYGVLNDLFHNKDVSAPIEVRTGDLDAVLSLQADFFHLDHMDTDGRKGKYQFQAAGNPVGSFMGVNPDSHVRRYQFDPGVVFGSHFYTHLAPPDGHNFTALLMSNAELLNEVNEIMASRDIFLNIDAETYSITQRLDRSKHVSVQLPYASISETLKRYVFLFAALRTNKDAILLLDEPEQNTFPFYTAHIAEIMAREPSNQYFITTHNQYLLTAIAEKAPAGQLQVFATFRSGQETRVRPIPWPELEELMQFDVFLNLDKLAEV